MSSIRRLALLGLFCAGQALADTVQVNDAWVRATAPGQKVAGGFMQLTADADMRLVGALSPVAGRMELHTMKMEGGVMVMRPVAEIPLPKGQTVSLKPGGLHLMFLELKGPLKAGDKVPVTLLLRAADGKEQRLEVQAEVRGQGRMPHGHH